MKAELGSIVMKRYGTNTEHGELCEVVAIINKPTYELKSVDGHVFTWVQEITRPATHEEEVSYWRERAQRAEATIPPATQEEKNERIP